jgi:hypothetical protein
MKLCVHCFQDIKLDETSIGGEKFHFILYPTNNKIKNEIQCDETLK